MDLKKLKTGNFMSSWNEKLVKIVLSFGAVIAVLFALFFWFQRYNTLSMLNSRANWLNLLVHYNTNSISKAKETKDIFPKWKNLNDIIKSNEDLGKEQWRYDQYIKDLQAPYYNFLQYIYLPSLNIWKNVYTQHIDTTLIWPKYLERNKYDKLSLIIKRSNFFKNVWDSTQFNDVTNVNIWDIQTKNWLFHIPISLSFTSPSKRSFLLLIEKLSITSNKENITLINEFMYNIRKTIKDKKKDLIENISYPWVLKDEKSIDKKIWYLMYHRVFDPNYNKWDIIDNSIIETAIAKSASCKQPWTKKCYYLFRDKYRTLPYLAYTIADAWINKTESLKLFLQDLPPIIKIKEFTFDQSRKAKFWKQKNMYEWKIAIDIVGRDIPDEDVVEIAKVLWSSCFDSKDKIMSIDIWIQSIDAYAVELASIAMNNVNKWQDLAKLKWLFEKFKKEYAWASNQKKIIKLFEIYRMLHDNNVCKL